MSELPRGWAWAGPGELATDAPNALTIGPFGSDLKVSDYRSEGTPLVFVRDIRAEEFGGAGTKYISPEKASALKRHIVRPGDLLVTKMGDPPGDTAVYPEDREPAVITADCIKLSPNSSLTSSEFLKYCLRASTVKEQLLEQTAGVAQQKLSLERFKTIRIPVPPLREQGRIVAKLHALQGRSRRAREALDEVPALLEKLRQSSLAAAFRGDLTKDWRARNPDAEPAERLVARTPEPGGKSTGRSAATTIRAGRYALAVGDPGTPPPPRWAWIPLSRIARMESGHTPSRECSEYWHGSIPWLGIRDARQHHGKTVLSTLQTVTEEGLANSAARLLPAGTVCLSRTASVGYVTIMGRPMATSQDFANWICSNALLPEYLMYALLAEGEHLRRFGEGTTHTTIYFPELKALHICLPPLQEQGEIVTRVRDRLARVEGLRDAATLSLHALPQLNESLLTKAFRGELVPQDPSDEPADVMLARLKASASSPTSSPGSSPTSGKRKGRPRKP